MKYTEKQKNFLKFKQLHKLKTEKTEIPTVIIKDGFYIVESKINL